MYEPETYTKTTTVTVEAMRYTRNGMEAEAVAKWCDGMQTSSGIEVINADHGAMYGEYGDYVVLGSDGEFFIVKRAVFEAEYA